MYTINDYVKALNNATMGRTDYTRTMAAIDAAKREAALRGLRERMKGNEDE